MNINILGIKVLRFTVDYEQKSEKNYYIILIFQHYFFLQMQRLYNTPYNMTSFYEQTQQTFNINQFNGDNQNILTLLYGHKQVIQKLLENQNVLKARFQGNLRLQTTDTQNSRHDSEGQNAIQTIQKPENICKTVNTILLKQQRQCIAVQKKALKQGIQIFCSCPIGENFTNEQLQQKGQIKQLQKPLEQNKKCCETKNIIKNYGKSILMFLRKNKALVKKVLDLYEYDESQFYSQFQKFRDRMNSITELKLFWTQEGNQFAKIYRIISNIYLKRYSLKHTFSSRVKNYGVHIKYRKRLLDVLKNPSEFSSIKYL